MNIDQYLAKNYHFCPRCRAKLINDGEHLSCVGCDFVFYYNPAPAVAIVAFNDDGEVLLNRRKNYPFIDDWDSVGGFVDVKESAEQAVKREFKEETQANCKIVKYWGSSPDFYGQTGQQTINLFFEVKIDKNQKLIPSDDAAELRFFPLDQLPDNIAFANTREFLKLLIKNKGQNVRK